LNDYYGAKNPSLRQSFDILDDLNVDDKSLQSVVQLAKKEIEEESNKRKVIKQN
jgi:hypothetical protein